MDAKGTCIQATIKNHLIPKFRKSVFEDRVYIIQNFILSPNTTNFKFTTHQYRMTFHEATLVTDLPNSVIPKCLYHFTSFQDILSKQLDETYAYDIMAEIVGCSGVLQSSGARQARRCELELRDDNNVMLHCTLWGSYADQVSSYLQTHRDGAIVMVFMLGKLKKFSGNMEISNSYNSARLLLNPDLLEAHEFVKRLNADQELYGYRVAKIDHSPTCSYGDYFLHAKNYANIDALKSFGQACNMVIRAKVSHLETMRGWSYLGCLRCGKKVDISDGDISCRTCIGDPSAVAGRRYRVQISVVDNSGSTTLTLFDKEAIDLIGVSAERLYMEMVEVGDAEAFPEELDSIVDQEYLFLVKVSGYNSTNKNSPYTVLAVEKQLHLHTSALEKEIDDLFPDLLYVGATKSSEIINEPQESTQLSVSQNHSPPLSMDVINVPLISTQISPTESSIVEVINLQETSSQLPVSQVISGNEDLMTTYATSATKIQSAVVNDVIVESQMTFHTPTKRTYKRMVASIRGSLPSVNKSKKVKTETIEVTKLVLDSPEKCPAQDM